MTNEIKQTERTKLKRIPRRGSFDRDTIYAILDEAFICHIGFEANGQTFVLPTAYARDGDHLLIHGSAASRMMREMAKEIDICITVTLLDGLVLARSAFHHSMNYRSVVIFGAAQIIEGESEKERALHLFTEHIIPGRYKNVRPSSSKELKGTTVLKLEINEASAKIRMGDPVDDPEDMDMDCWAGVLPLKIIAGDPIDDSQLKKGIDKPDYLLNYKRG
jgi:uncharacterized protein